VAPNSTISWTNEHSHGRTGLLTPPHLFLSLIGDCLLRGNEAIKMGYGLTQHYSTQALAVEFKHYTCAMVYSSTASGQHSSGQTVLPNVHCQLQCSSSNMESHSLQSMGLSGYPGGLSGKADNRWKRGEFIVEVSLPGPTHTLPGHPLIQCKAPATRLNGWSWEVGGQCH